MGVAIAAAMFLLEVAQEIFREWKVEFISLAAIADVDAATEVRSSLPRLVAKIFRSIFFQGGKMCIRDRVTFVSTGVFSFTLVQTSVTVGCGGLGSCGDVYKRQAYTWLLQRCPPALVATHTYANPVVAVFLGWLLASEPLTMRVVLASGTILGAIVLIRKGERTTKSAVVVAESGRPIKECA